MECVFKKCKYKGTWCSLNASLWVKAEWPMILKIQKCGFQAWTVSQDQPQGHALTKSESDLNLELTGVFGILKHAQPYSDMAYSAGVPGGTLSSPVCELLLSVSLHLCDKSAKDPGQRSIFSHSSWGQGPSPPSNECHKQRNWLRISLLCCHVQGELGFWLKDWSSTCISFEYFVVACSADLSFPGCMRKWYDIVWLHKGPGLWCLSCSIASHNIV